MTRQTASKTTSDQNSSGHLTRAASLLSYERLAEIYNETRIDYIVPMPMNAKRMREYVVNYDIDLDASVVAIDEDDGEPNGLAMLGIRDERAWITRLGVIPERRRKRTGQFLMVNLIEQARLRGCAQVQLEVIAGNDPAYRLFSKLGFEPVRELMIIRRPPGKCEDCLVPPDDIVFEPIAGGIVEEVLAFREPGASWVEETPSLLQSGGLKGLRAWMPDGESGWIVYRETPFQLQHFVFGPGSSFDLMVALLYHVHQSHPLQDTKIENVPTDHFSWPVFQQMGYFEVFRRIEMILEL